MATAPFTDGPITVDQQYESASHTSDMTVSGGLAPHGHKNGPGDVIAAAGMAAVSNAPARIGLAILRLHTEWTSAPIPKRRPLPTLAEIAARMPLVATGVKNGRTIRTADMERAARALAELKVESARWYANEVRLVATRLHSRKEVLASLTAWGATKGIAPETVSASLHWWLSHTCPVCEGHGIRHLEHQGARQCGECYGTGETRRPEGSGQVLNHIDYALGMARGSLRKRLRRG